MILKALEQKFRQSIKLAAYRRFNWQIYSKMSKISFVIVKCLLTAALVACSVEALQISCLFFTYSVTTIGSRYVCFSRVTNYSSADLESVTGVNQEGKSYEDVGFLRIFNEKLMTFPGGIGKFFRNLDALQIYKSSLKSIKADDLRPFPRLVYIDLGFNHLTSIDGDLFKNTPLLQHVDLWENRIQHIGYNLVANLDHLTFLWLFGNDCIDTAAIDRATVLVIASQMSILCPPLDVKTITEASTATIDQLPLKVCAV